MIDMPPNIRSNRSTQQLRCRLTGALRMAAPGYMER